MEVTFILPLVLLPGVALLIVSTSARYGQLHDEVHRYADHHDDQRGSMMLKQARLFRNALVGLYLCVTIFALCAIIGVILEASSISSRGVIVALTAAGCLCLFYAASQLVREAMISLQAIEAHLDAGH
jgi:uncharacterized protein DUF2721